MSFEPWQWADVLGEWSQVRRYLWREFRIPVTQELHTTAYVNGRTRISINPPDKCRRNGLVLWKDLGRDVATKILDRVASIQGLHVGAITATGASSLFADTKVRLYAHLLALFEQDLASRDALGIVLVDGDGSDGSYRAAHRNLPRPTRRIIEDPVHLDSAYSQLIQLADLVAWSANTCADPHPKNAFAHDWYSTYLAPRDIRRGPLVIQLWTQLDPLDPHVRRGSATQRSRTFGRRSQSPQTAH